MDKWRLIDAGAGSAYYNMALDEAVAEGMRNGASPPALRLYGWDKPSVSIGCFQRAADIDMGYCKEAGIAVVRRPTGGRAILHGKELTYSFSSGAPTAFFSASLLDNYKKISTALTMALKAVGYEAESRFERKRLLRRSPLCFMSVSYGEITVGGFKMIGSAQRRWKEAFLQQGSIPLSIDKGMVRRVFGENGVLEGITGLSDIMPIVESDIKDALAAAFERCFAIGLERSEPTPEEVRRAVDLMERKYLRDEWNLRK